MSSRQTGSARTLAVLAMLASVLLAVPAEAADRTVAVKFKPGAVGATQTGSIKGYDTVTYVAGARAGQVMQVLFSGKGSIACYFNVVGPDGGEALFDGASKGNEFGANLTASGDYRIQVYQMRVEARRGKTCAYKLSIEISG